MSEESPIAADFRTEESTNKILEIDLAFHIFQVDVERTDGNSNFDD